jgi:imidazolonepropionase-like amidohydrolase
VIETVNADSRLVLTSGHVFDPVDGKAHRADVCIEGDSIVDVGIGLDGDVSRSVAGATLFPGFIDCHVHVLLSHLDFWRLASTPLSYRILESGRNLARTLEAGITTVRDAAGADAGIRDGVRDGLIRGPRVQVAIGMVSQTGGHNDSWLPSGQCVASLFPTWPGVPDCVVDGPEPIRRTVRALARAGADVIKVATSGGVLSPTDAPSQAHFAVDELEMLVSEARAAGLWVMAHAQAGAGVKNAVRAGVRSVEHGIYLDDESIDAMLSQGTYLVPTLGAPRAVLAAGDRGVPVPDAFMEQAREVIATHRESLRAAAAAGVPIALGTDAGITKHGRNLDELELMRDAGMSVEQCLRAATLTAARLLGVDARAGTIEAGKLADLVAVSGDPLSLAGLADRVVAVFRAGKEVRHPKVDWSDL